MKNRLFAFLLTVFVLVHGICSGKEKPASAPVVPAAETIAQVVSAFPVGFDMFTGGGRLFVAYYDADHRMTLAARDIASGEWEYRRLDEKVPWDAHNAVVMAPDRDGYIHLSGNMHGVPLVYFRSAKPYDIQSMERMPGMTGDDEQHVTYPVFMRDKDGNLIFHYRSGGSGNGYEVYNIYDPDAKAWKRLLDKPLINGRTNDNTRNAYMQGPVTGPDGWFHLIWVWRDTPDCATNHTLSYARSRDLQHWESIRGEQVPLPITFEDSVLRVDATPPGGGMFNPGIRLGFDSKGRPVIGYHKYDRNGNNQLYITRYENGAWKRSQLTDWDYRWPIEGYGSMPTELEISRPYALGKGKIAFGYAHSREGRGEVVVNEKTLRATGTRPAPATLPEACTRLVSDFPGMEVRTLRRGDWLLKWESLQANKDRRPDVVPPPSELILYKIR